MRSLGKYDEAKKAFQEAILLDSDYEAAKKCLKGLEGLDQALDISNRLSKNA